MVPRRPIVPPSKCIGPAPAASIKPIFVSQPSPKTHELAIGKMIPAINSVKKL